MTTEIIIQCNTAAVSTSQVVLLHIYNGVSVD